MTELEIAENTSRIFDAMKAVEMAWQTESISDGIYFDIMESLALEIATTTENEIETKLNKIKEANQ